ncbi:homoserine kinase [Jeotgalibacillus marinus]|uniref:Homoserine kinase n=1 Tax=Jeotgalibacillus marinus TaxID=86667 RepID=A0ABV3Q6P6_9BACL
MTFAPFQVKVPATTANLGPGFDSIGLALQVYQSVRVIPSSTWCIEYEDETHKELSIGNDNIIMSTIKKVESIFNQQSPTASLSVRSNIPLSRGMGSSAAAIVAGIAIAEQLLGLNLSDEQKVKIASDIEGHPDNVSAALVGGLTVSRYDQHELDFIKLPTHNVGILLMVPSHELETSLSRGSLPEVLSHKKATSSSAAANVMLPAILMNDWSTAGKLMEKDGFHEPYRTKWLQSFEDIRHYAKELGAYGCTISGAGPSLVIFCPQESQKNIHKELELSYPNYICIKTRLDSIGTTVSPIYLKENMQPPV